MATLGELLQNDSKHKFPDPVKINTVKTNGNLQTDSTGKYPQSIKVDPPKKKNNLQTDSTNKKPIVKNPDPPKYIGKFQTDSTTATHVTHTDISGIDTILRMQGIVTDMMYDKYQRFKRYPLIDISEDVLRGTKEYIFITKPELNIYSDKLGTVLNEQFALQPMFKNIQERHPRILRQLQFNLSSHESPFINLLSYTCMNTIDLDDTNAKEIYTAQNIFGTKINYRGHSLESDQDKTFTLEFRDNSIAEVYTFFRLWDKYENLKALGIVKPPSPIYTQKRILHDKVGAYKFIVDETSTLVFWAYWWGAIPDGAPRSAWSETSDTVTESVTFKADFVDDMDPQILVDFNELVDPFRKKCKYKTSPGWITQGDRLNYTPQIIPYIQYDKHTRNYKLKWQGGTI